MARSYANIDAEVVLKSVDTASVRDSINGAFLANYLKTGEVVDAA